MGEPRLSVLRPDVWPALAQRLLEASRRSASSTPRDTLSRPLELLALMAADAPAALGDDALAAERLRMLLHLAAPYHALVDEAHSLEPAGSKAAEGSYEPGVLDHGALGLLALAAMRVATRGSEQLFVETVHGLALSAAPAEALGRLVPRMPEADGLAVILDTLYLLDTVGAALKAPALRPFANDPVERARWRCLAQLFEQDLPSAVGEALARANVSASKPSPWDGATAAGIEDVQPQRAAAGEPLLITGRLKALGGGTALPDNVRVVFAGPHGPPIPATPISYKARAKGAELRVEVPAGAQGGWLGFSDDKLIASSNAFRAALRELLPGTLQRKCLRGSEVRRDLPPSLGSPDPDRPTELLAVPPRTASNRWAGAPSTAPAVRTEMRTGVTSIAVSVQKAAPRILAARAHQGAREEPLYLGQPLQVAVTIDPAQLGGELSMALKAFPAPPGQAALAPDHAWAEGQPFRFTVPEALVQQRLLLVATLLLEDEPIGSPCDIGPLTFATPRKEQIVLVRPLVLGDGGSPRPPVEMERVHPFLQRHAAQLGVDLSIVELPWVDDELAVLAAPILSGGDARIPGLLEALSRRAMLTPFLEGAVWLLLVPEAPIEREGEKLLEAAGSDLESIYEALIARACKSGRGFFCSSPAEAARAVAVADPLGLPDLLCALYRADESRRLHVSPTTRLRLLGTFDESNVHIESVQEELRGAGPGAPVETEFMLVTLDRRGRELHVARLMALRKGRPAQLAALIPVFPEVAAVEVRRREKRLIRIDRTPGKGELQVAELKGAPTLAPDQKLRWCFRHSRHAHPATSLALGWGRLSTEVQRIDACDHEPRVFLTRYRRASRLHLFASDGWNLAGTEVTAADGKTPASFENPTPVLIRKLADGRFFADVPAGWKVTWSLDGARLGDGTRLLALPRGTRGTLQLEAQSDGETAPVLDARCAEA